MLDSRVTKDSVKVEKVVVEVHDTIMETTTITVDRNETGDTLKVAQVTERDRIRDRAQVNDRSEMVRVVRDTVFIEKRDSVSTTTNFTNGTNPKSSKNAIVQGLKWIFWIIVAVIVLMIVVRIRGRP
ncbi:MAG: hypothetical protein IJK46_05105 [Prevotella sp.]|nr:hypothetical protein [Prevotella sp.]MBR0265780.1 hypothetical protein [Prevotella sp.]